MFNKNLAFTLAEVLITLGVIGVVAALTIPTLITNYQKHQVETQLLHFYSTINQAFRLSIDDNGEPDTWAEGRKYYSYDENYKIVQDYVAPYLKNLGYKRCKSSSAHVCITLPDGGQMSFVIDGNGGDIIYYTQANLYGNTSIPKSHYLFAFQFAKLSGKGDGVTNSKNFVEPYIFTWNGTRDALINSKKFGCSKKATEDPYVFCTKLIQENGWKIPSDYPW
jgi:type II secretory pathway pseudopilin PulG